MTRRRRLAWGAAVVLLAALVLLVPTTEDADATLAVRRFLANMGFEVADREELPPADATLILLGDLRDVDEAEQLLAWAEDGGTLVVAAPGTATTDLVGAATAGPLGFAGNVELVPGCLTSGVVGVERLVARAGDRALAQMDDGLIACFPTADGAFMLTRPHGEGTVTLLGGTGPFTNGLLTEADNAALAAQLAGPGPQVVFGGPGSPADVGTGGVWEALPDRGRAAIIGVIGAAVAFALVRARRLGRPTVEAPITPIPGSELVRAAARMYRRARASAHAGSMLRQASLSRFGRRLGAGGGARDLSPILARATGLAEPRVADILAGPEPRTDEELITLGRELDELAARAEQGSR